MKIRNRVKSEGMTLLVGHRSFGKREAFSLVEVMVAFGILGLVIGTMFTCFSLGFASIRLTQENLRAAQILTEKMETIRLYTWTQVNTAGFIPTNFTAAFNTGTNGSTNIVFNGTMSISDASLSEAYSANVKLVTVAVAWTNSGVPRQRTMSTLISKNGIQNYQF